MITCRVCREEKTDDNYYAASKPGCVDKICSSCKIRRTRRARKSRRRSNKLALITLLGGKCEKCGYDKCQSALQFHHLDPTQKDPQFRRHSLRDVSLEKAKEELEKCILVCANCHAELHEQIDLPDNHTGWLGRKHDEHTKKLIGQKNKISQAGERNSQFGSCWIFHNPSEKCVRIPRVELDKYLLDGWTKGRKMLWV